MPLLSTVWLPVTKSASPQTSAHTSDFLKLLGSCNELRNSVQRILYFLLSQEKNNLLPHTNSHLFQSLRDSNHGCKYKNTNDNSRIFCGVSKFELCGVNCTCSFQKKLTFTPRNQSSSIPKFIIQHVHDIVALLAQPINSEQLIPLAKICVLTRQLVYIPVGWLESRGCWD